MRQIVAPINSDARADEILQLVARALPEVELVSDDVLDRAVLPPTNIQDTARCDGGCRLGHLPVRPRQLEGSASIYFRHADFKGSVISSLVGALEVDDEVDCLVGVEAKGAIGVDTNDRAVGSIETALVVDVRVVLKPGEQG